MKLTIKCGSSRCGILFLYSTHHHTKVLSFNNYCYPKWIQCFFNGIFNLYSQSFLDLQTPGKHINHSCNFTETGYPTIWDIRYMSLTNKRQHMMFTHTINLDVFYYDHLAHPFMKFC